LEMWKYHPVHPLILKILIGNTHFAKARELAIFAPEPKNRQVSQRLTEGEDFYFNEQGLMVLTAKYLAKRGYCCKNACKHCPYGFRKAQAKQQKKV